jgi:transposase
VLPHYIPYPRPQSILILDNALIYKLAQLYDLYKEHGVLLIFLLLYSPDYNPIKAIFKDLKA